MAKPTMIIHRKTLVAIWKRLEDSVNNRVILKINSQLGLKAIFEVIPGIMVQAGSIFWICTLTPNIFESSNFLLIIIFISLSQIIINKIIN